jgi:hypothetical protein
MLWAEFLARTPPGVIEEIENLYKKSDPYQEDYSSVSISDTDIQIYCDSDKCKGVRFFHVISTPQVNINALNYDDVFVDYWCRNCRINKKTFALRVTRLDTSNLNGTAQKFGDLPAFGPPIPSRVISLIGPDREIFLRGRRAENQGLGIGAFAYYRRVVENQRGRLISDIAKVEKIGRFAGSPKHIRTGSRGNSVQ